MAGRVVKVSPPRRVVATGGARGRLSLDRLPIAEARRAGLARCALGASLAALAGGAVGADYVGAAYFSLLVPLVIGLACGWAASRGAGRVLPPWVGSGVAAGYAAAGAALSFRFASTPYGAVGTWLPPLAAAAAGALVWQFVDPRPWRARAVHRPRSTVR